jgi:hypothetical protein
MTLMSLSSSRNHWPGLVRNIHVDNKQKNFLSNDRKFFRISEVYFNLEKMKKSLLTLTFNQLHTITYYQLLVG